MSAFQYCIKYGARSSVRQLLELRKSNPGQDSGKQGKNAQVALVKKMCELSKDPRAYPALHTAARDGNLQIVKLLLEAGASADARTCFACVYGRTPIDVAFKAWESWLDVKDKQSQIFEDIIVELLRRGKPETSGWALKLDCASERRSVKVFQAFEKWHSEKDEYGWTPAMVATQSRLNVARNHNSTRLTDLGTKPPTRWSSTDKDSRLTVSGDGLLVSSRIRGEINLFAYFRNTRKLQLSLFYGHH